MDVYLRSKELAALKMLEIKKLEQRVLLKIQTEIKKSNVKQGRHRVWSSVGKEWLGYS